MASGQPDGGYGQTGKIESDYRRAGDDDPGGAACR